MELNFFCNYDVLLKSWLCFVLEIVPIDGDQLNIFFERLCFEFQMNKILGSDLLLKFFEPTTCLSGILKWLEMYISCPKRLVAKVTLEYHNNRSLHL